MMVYSRWFAASLKLTDISVQYLLRLAMNKQSKSLGKRSTNTASLSNAINNIKTQIDPTIVVRACRAQPRQLKTASEQWTRRTVRVFLSQANANTAILTYGKIHSSAGLASGVNFRLRILDIKAWNITEFSANSNYIKVVTDGSVLESNAVTQAEDVGSASNLAGVWIHFPRTHSDDKLVTGSLSTNVLNINGFPVVPTTYKPQTYCLDCHVEYKISDLE